MLKAVIFDFDGVIADSETLHLKAFNEVLGQFGLRISEKDYYEKYLGLSDLDLFNLLIDENRLKIERYLTGSLIKQKNLVFTQMAKTEAHIIDGVTEFLQMLRQSNIATAICSGALLSEIRLMLAGGKLEGFFEVIVSAEEVSKGKPDPQGFVLTLKKLNKRRGGAILNEECVVIEDSHWGLEAAKAAGMHTVGITNSYDAEQLGGAEKIVAHLNELSIESLEELCKKP